ncbi:NUDIX hydrolase [Arthrobacter zhaoguopingii]|uniref:NUDIX hydrolase n=1 Tax=Arthrobacter zhaoguopingii TaxID=2681491 RepID=UPI001359E728|nr:NUDIX domain-containing protein [Arthrobacter zhaoguopingii]
MVPTDEVTAQLQQYPRPSVAVDTAVLTSSAGRLQVLLVKSPLSRSGWALPGTFVHQGETLAQAVLRSLRDKAGVSGRTPRQLHVFDDPGRDPRGWVLSVAHVDLVAERDLPPFQDESASQLVDVEEILAGGLELSFDHPVILAKALEYVRSAYAEHPDPYSLMKEPFTLRDLRALHEVVAGESLQRDTFRRMMEPQLKETGRMTDGGRGRPSRLFRR